MKTHYEHGAALVETVVLLMLLIPLALGVPMIGKMIDLKQTTVQASRYAAWESTVHDDMPVDMNARFFGDISNPIKNDPSDESAVKPNALWGEPVTDEESADTASDSTATPESTTDDGTEFDNMYSDLYWIDSGVIVDSASADASSSSAYTADADGANAHDGPAKVIGEAVGSLGVAADATGGVWNEGNNGMDMDGLMRTEVSASTQGNGWINSQTFTQGTVILNDNWSASNARQARDRVRTLVPAGALRPIGQIMGYMGEVPGVTELKYFKHDNGRGVFGYVNMEPLPPSETEELRPLKQYEED